jgi:hypothetical protein
LARDLFLSLYFELYILPTCPPLGAFLGRFGAAQMPQSAEKKTIF